MLSDPVALTRQLLRMPSLTPDDAGCQAMLANWLEPQGFFCTHMPFGGVHNLWAVRGSGAPLAVFAGHTDVVPTGDSTAWHHPPFAGTLVGDRLYGRGAADMKGSIGAFIAALPAIDQQQGSLAVLLTSDEEGPAVDGTARVVDELLARGVKADYVVVGEPTSRQQVGDCVRIGRRGSLSARVQVTGKGGHVAYPQQVVNPIQQAACAIVELAGRNWDADQARQLGFPPTSLQFTRIACDSGAGNVVPRQLEASCNVRFSPALDHQQIEREFAASFARAGVQAEFDWTLSAKPFVSRSGRLHQLVAQTIVELIGIQPELSTGGGTSDGRFLIALSDQLIELGPCNATIHQYNEYTSASGLHQLRDMYARLFSRLLGKD